MGLGETFVILLGSIDLSIAPVAAMATIIAAMLIPKFGFLAFVIALLFGVFAGWLTGFVHTRGENPFVHRQPWGNGFMDRHWVCRITSYPNYGHQRRQSFLTKWVTGTTFGVDNVVYIAAVVLFITYILEKYTRFGRYVKAIGAGEKATRVSGVPIDRYKTLAFMLCGTLAAFTGVLLSARMAGGSARMADGFLDESHRGGYPGWHCHQRRYRWRTAHLYRGLDRHDAGCWYEYDRYQPLVPTGCVRRHYHPGSRSDHRPVQDNNYQINPDKKRVCGRSSPAHPCAVVCKESRRCILLQYKTPISFA